MAATLLRLITITAAATAVLGHAVVKVPTPRGVSALVTFWSKRNKVGLTQ
jgi:hypothetical protein